MSDTVREHFKSCPECEYEYCCSGGDCGCLGLPINAISTSKCGPDCFVRLCEENEELSTQLNKIKEKLVLIKTLVVGHRSPSEIIAIIDPLICDGHIHVIPEVSNIPHDETKHCWCCPTLTQGIDEDHDREVWTHRGYEEVCF